jgi:cullin-associated NEDD8-dissociated protein 1
MRSLLQDVGVAGYPEVVGKVIGNLLVYGGSSVGVKLEQFVQELETAPDDKRKCLALVVLGESALRLGAQSTIDPKLFIKFFNTRSEQVPLAAAVALGRAGAGNVSKYLPIILSTMGQASAPQYLLLHSIKEILQQDDTESEIIPYASTLWQNLVAASQLEDNKAIGAECIGRLTIIDPKTYLPQLQVSHAFLWMKNPFLTCAGLPERSQGKCTWYGHLSPALHIFGYRRSLRRVLATNCRANARPDA